MIILIFLLFFFVGFLKQVLAGYPGDCTKVKYVKLQEAKVTDPRGRIGIHDSWIIGSTGYPEGTGDWNVPKSEGTVYFAVLVYSFFRENGIWHSGGGSTMTVVSMGPGEQATLDTVNKLPEEECPNDCEDEKAAKRTECGGDQNVDWSTWNDETCTGKCKCNDERQAKIELCGGEDKVDWTNWDNETCSGAECLPDCTEQDLDRMRQEKLDCAPLTYLWDSKECVGECMDYGDQCKDELAQAREKCGKYGIASFSMVDCSYHCNPNCDGKRDHLMTLCSPRSIGWFNDDTCKGGCDRCSKVKKQCEAACANRGGTVDNSCVETRGGTMVATCTCKDEIPIDEDGNPLAGHEDGEDTPAQGEPNKDSPDAEPDDGEDSAPKPDEQPRDNLTDKILDDISKKLSQALNNDVKIGNKIDQVVQNSGRRTDSELGNFLGGKLDGILNALDNLNNSNYNSDGDPNGDPNGDPDGDPDDDPDGEPGERAYKLGKEYNFIDRSNLFIQQMKETDIFQLPGQVLGDIPNGGDSTLIIEAGQYGTHSFDFANWGNALLILRAVVLIAFSWVSLRIVLLKR